MNIDLENLIPLATDYGLRIVGALAIFVIGKWIAAKVTKLLRLGMEKRETDPVLISFLSSLSSGLLMVLVIITALGTLGIETTSFAAVIAAGGLAIGLALQGSLSNFASGVLIILFRPFRARRLHRGRVETSVSWMKSASSSPSSNPRTIKKSFLPNSAIMGGSITNFSAHETRRVDLVIGVSYADDLDKVDAVLREVLQQDERVLKDPEPFVGVFQHADNSVNFAVRPWVNKADYWPVLTDMHKNHQAALRRRGHLHPLPPTRYPYRRRYDQKRPRLSPPFPYTPAPPPGDSFYPLHLPPGRCQYTLSIQGVLTPLPRMTRSRNRGKVWKNCNRKRGCNVLPLECQAMTPEDRFNSLIQEQSDGVYGLALFHL
jgi:small conductance mechanosensitive channel